VGKNGLQAILAAMILGASMLGGAYMLSNAVDGVANQIPDFESAMKNLQVAAAAGEGAPAAAAPAPPPRRRGPDPDKVYKVTVEGSAYKGPKDAAVTLVEFSDFQCPFCGRVGPTLKRINEEYPDSVKIVFKHLPLSFHQQAQGAAEASEAAHIQGKFWEMHDRIFSDQRSLSPDKYVEWAGELGLDVEKFKTDMKSPAVLARINSDKKHASELGVTGTPGFFVNGRFISGAKPFGEFKTAIDKALSKG
jgi:protein-disulfide isomerase